MHLQIVVGDIRIPTYGLIVLFGTIIVFVLGMAVCRYRKLDIRRYLLLFIIGGITALISARLWDHITYVIQSNFLKTSYAGSEKGGYSFYGGLLMGALTVFVTSKFLRLEYSLYARYLTFLVPLLHSFWKIGCYVGGCCYGIPYTGIGAVVFPEGANYMAGISLFPIQLVESSSSFLIALFFFIAGIRNMQHLSLRYLEYYAGTRFFVEFLRVRSTIFSLSIAQWTSIVVFVITKYILIKRKMQYKEEPYA